jgi:hypothetical protein
VEPPWIGLGPPPPRGWVSLGAIASQVILGVALFVALVPFAILLVKADLGGSFALATAVVAGGCVGLYAGGPAYRGSVRGLVACLVLDLALAAYLFTRVAAAAGAPAEVRDLAEWTVLLLGVAAAGAGIACALAVPQARRLRAWRRASVSDVFD